MIEGLKGKRLVVYNKYGGKCAYCGCDLDKSYHIDHLEPVQRHRVYNREKHRWEAAGLKNPEKDCIENMMPSCPSCNINKHSMGLEDFRNQILGFMKHLNGVNTQYKIAKRYGLVIEDIKPVVFYFEKLQNNKA